MSIQAGGKLPSAVRTPTMDRPRRAAEKRQAREANPTPEPTKKDVYEAVRAHATVHTPAAGTAVPASLLGQKLDEFTGHPSQIQQLAETLTAHTRKLAGEFDSLRTEAQGVVQGLAAKGFSPEAVSQTRGELGELRKQMAQLRGRIAAGGRRLKLLKAEASKLGESKLTDKIGAQLKRISDMEHGWGRAFLALGIAGTYSAAADGEGHGSLRVGLGAGAAVDRHALGGYLAQSTPGTAASQLLVSLLEEGPQTPAPRLVAEAYAELHADVLAGRFGKALQGLGMWRQAMG